MTDSTILMPEIRPAHAEGVFAPTQDSETIKYEKSQKLTLERISAVAVAVGLVSLPTTAVTVSAASDEASIVPTNEQFDCGSISWFTKAANQSQTEIIVQRVRQLSAYEEGWLTDSSKPASVKALRDAESFVREFEWQTCMAPDVSLAEDGEVNFAWMNSNLYLDLGFFGDGTYSFYAKRSDGETFTGDDVLVDDLAGRQLIGALISNS